MRSIDYAIAENREGALAALSQGYRPKAAGIDLLDMLKERTETHDRYVSLHRLEELKGIREADGMLVIGAMTTLRELAESDLVRTRFAALAASAGQAATPQVRARATVGGNILQRPRCWYFRAREYNCLKKGGSTCYAVEGENQFHAIFGEGPCHITHPSNIAPALVASEAELVLRKPTGQERTVAAEEFFVLPNVDVQRENTIGEDELMTEVRLPKLPEASGYVEFKQKQSFDWPMAACTAVRRAGGWRVVLSHVAPVPWRARAVEEALGGRATVDHDTAAEVARLATKDAQPMSQNAWRLKLAQAAVRRALLIASGKEIDA